MRQTFKQVVQKLNTMETVCFYPNSQNRNEGVFFSVQEALNFATERDLTRNYVPVKESRWD